MITKLQYIKSNWKLITHLLLRTKRFGVNNRLWNEFDSMFGQAWYKVAWGIITVRPIINNYYRMKDRAEALHFMTDKEKAIFGYKSKH